MTEELPDLEIGELVYAENIGAYAGASSTFMKRTWIPPPVQSAR